MTPNYTLADIPANREFTHLGVTLHKNLKGEFIWRGIPCVMLAPMDTDTGVPRDIFSINPTQVIACIANVYLVKHSDKEFFLEEYDETGTVGYAQFFTSAPFAFKEFTKQTLKLISELL